MDDFIESPLSFSSVKNLHLYTLSILMSKFHPIWIALKPDFILSRYSEIYCDEARLVDHLAQKLNYKGNDTAGIIQQISGYKQIACVISGG